MIYITEEHLGQDATKEDAEKLARCLQEKGWNVKYGSGQSWKFDDSEKRIMFEKDWDKCAMQLLASPEEQKTRTTVYIKDSILKKAKVYCATADIKLSPLIEELLRNFLEKKENNT